MQSDTAHGLAAGPVPADPPSDRDAAARPGSRRPRARALAHRLVLGTICAAMALSSTACGQDTVKPAPARSRAVGLLLPERTSSIRYETWDRPMVEAAIGGLCSHCTFDYANADGSEALQQEQFDDMLAKGIKVIMLDPVNAAITAPWIAKAAKQGVSVIAYDRLAAGKVAAYVSFDNRHTGELQGQALVEALGAKAPDAEIVMIDGAEADPNSADFREGAHQALTGNVKGIAYEESGEWSPDVAAQKMNQAIGKLGRNGFQAVYSANDGMAAAIIDTLKKAGRTDVPVGGQDASLDAVHRVLTGEQAYTIWKPYKQEADTAGNIAVDLLEGLDVSGLASSMTDSHGDQIPSMLLNTVVVTRPKIADTVVASRMYSAAEICSGQFAKACKEAGIPE